MPLDLQASTSNNIRVANNASIDDKTAFSWAMVYYPNNTGTGPQMFVNKGGVGSTNRRSLERVFGDVDDYEFGVDRATTNSRVVTTGVNRALNKWNYLFATYNETDGCRVYHGDEDTLATEAAYGTQTVGAGATDTDNAIDLYIGNRDTLGEVVLGILGAFQFYDTDLTLGQVRRLQGNLQPLDNCQIYHLYGLDGLVTNEVDYSGNGNVGARTGGALSASAPFNYSFSPSKSLSEYVITATTTAKSLSQVAIGTASISLTTTFLSAPSMTAMGASSVAKLVKKNLNLVAAGMNSVLKKASIAMGYTSTGTSTLSESVETSQSASATATGTGTLSTVFIAAVIGLLNFIKRIALRLGLGL